MIVETGGNTEVESRATEAMAETVFCFVVSSAMETGTLDRDSINTVWEQSIQGSGLRRDVQELSALKLQEYLARIS